MLTRFFCLIVFLVFAYNGVNAQQADLVKYVNPLAGTATSTTPSALKHGSVEANFANTIPSVCTPLAMTQWTAQTQLTEKKCIPPYYYKDNVFYGFRGTHWISGSCMQDYGSLTIMPVTGRLKVTDNASEFNHSDELATPYLYRLNLPGSKLTAAVTATPRCGIMQFTAAAADSLYLLITPNSDFGEGFIKVDEKRGEIYGYNPVHRIYQGWGKPAGFNGYFVIKIDRALSRYGMFAGNKLIAGDSIISKKDLGVYIGLKVAKGEKVNVRVGTSFSSIAGARKNLAAEIPGWDFEHTVLQCKAVWQQALKQIQVATPNEADKRIFYTSFYHALQHPRLYNDIDGTYPMFSSDHQLGKLASGNYYDDFSLWDIYRAQIPLLEILQPKLVDNLVQSLILKGVQGGWLPIFPCWNSYTSEMIGDHTTSVITSAYLKGISRVNLPHAYRLMRRNAFELPANKSDYIEGKGRRALHSYLQYGYIPQEDSVKDAFHKMEQVSRTLEYAYDDYALSLLSKKMGFTSDYTILQKRALNYKNVFDLSVNSVRARMKDGTWLKAFDADKKQTYITEGTPRQYTFYVPQDVPGLARLMGGRAKLEQALDSIFIKNEYWHGNEPGHQIPFMYNYTGSSWKTQQQVHAILQNEYSDGPGGLGGNDDAGQMSAWYMFAAMGFYPLNPVSGDYLLCSPVFNSITVNLARGKKLKIICHKQSGKSLYIYQVKRDGKLYPKNYITYNHIMNGGILEIYLQDTPAKSLGNSPANQPKGLAAIK
ncbi:GH92 family glycosyl hydrolase [Mucilaginibacter phyllosphaerae]|uniref:Alpha-1,2-mannosidase n=1 Tax=Mucilaginibacter phyllosphaerae TaxID=1812349 RepID=A0A4Y8AJN2_9SPHI|nr:GH92 family glycosyl hydrolase [Mucilaginibacter phyllosphaerae]MBB3967708.1 putative alpha-1,2-mannosidase [Mucilaginibacter phyllosphaerae]TEW69238.1 glycoside hydrolase family 92 protein [Mucilaginibacter phyllosphaerae]GGH03849.1 alpha-1 2-mannosidase [Mucilaginibacter phyllosphaerae]